MVAGRSVFGGYGVNPRMNVATDPRLIPVAGPGEAAVLDFDY